MASNVTDITSSSSANEKLLQATERGDKDEVKHLLQSVQMTAEEGAILLHTTCKGGHDDLLQYLIKEKGLDVTAEDSQGRTVLHTACLNGRYNMVKFLLTTYPNSINASDNGGKSAWHYSAEGGDVEIFKLFVDQGLDIQSLSKDGSNVLHFACRSRQLDMVKYLVSLMYSSLKNKVNNTGKTALHSAAEGGDVEIFKLLADLGWDVHCVSKRNMNVLHIACQYGNYDMVRHLDLSYTNLKSKSDYNGYKALHFTAQGGNVKILKYLVDKGMDVYHLSHSRQTILHIACHCGNAELVKYLLEMYPQLKEKVDNKHNSALHYSVLGGQLTVFQYLHKEANFDVHQKDKFGNNVLHMACHFSGLDLIQYIVNLFPVLKKDKNEKGQTPLQLASELGNVELFKLLFKKEKNLYSSSGYNVLHTACLNGRYNMVQYVATRFPQLKSQVDKENTVLHSCAEGGHVDIFKYLVQEGKMEDKVYIKNKNGQTVLHLASMNGNLDMVKHLVSQYPQLKDMETSERKTALLEAADSHHDNIITYLMDQGPYTSIEESYFSTKGHKKAKKYLFKFLYCQTVKKTADNSDEEYEDQTERTETARRQVIGTEGADAGAVGADEADGGNNWKTYLLEEGATTCSSTQNMEKAINQNQTTRPKDVPILSASKVRTCIHDQGTKSPEVRSLLQWFCRHIETALPDQQGVCVSPGYHVDKPSEPIFLAMTNHNPKDEPTEFDSFSLFVRRVGDISDEGKVITSMEIEKNLQFTHEEQNSVQECLRRNTKKLMEKHSNLEIVSASKVKSRRYGMEDAEVKEQICIVLYVHVKGIVPFYEEPFPEEIDGFSVDVREGLFQPYVYPDGYKEKLVMGCQIASASGPMGSLGGFVELNNGNIGCLTCWHIFQADSSQDQQVYQPDNSSQRLKIGFVQKKIFNPGDENSIGVDAALIQITDPNRLPVNGNFPNATSQVAGFSLEKPMVFNSGKVFNNFNEVPKSGYAQKYGTTTGHTVGMLRLEGSAVHKRRYKYSIGANNNEEYELFNQFEIFHINNQPFSKPGDSGSLVFIVTHHGETYDIRALGLLVGGTSNNTTIVTPIWAVLDKLGLPRNFLPFHDSENTAATQTGSEQVPSTIESDVSTLKAEVSELRAQTSTMHQTLGNVQTKMDDVDSKLENMKDDVKTSVDRKLENMKDDVKTSVDRKLENMKDDVKTSVDRKLENMKDDVKSSIINLQQVLLQAMSQKSTATSSDKEPEKQHSTNL